MRRREFIALTGASIAWPVAALAQQPAPPVIGFLCGGTEAGPLRSAIAGFHQGLGEFGFTEGRNVEILYRWAETHNDRWPALAADLVRRRVALIVATASPGAALAAKSATATIPIVFQIGVDPVEFGLVASMSHPGGNVTGTSFLIQELVAKRLELLHQIVPTVTTMGFLVNPTMPGIETQIREAEVAARTLGCAFGDRECNHPKRNRSGLRRPCQARDRRADGRLRRIIVRAQYSSVALAARHASTTIVDAGGLISYGSIFADAFRLAGVYAGRILKGEEPADLPVEESAKVELVINMKTANATGFTVPPALLVRADKVIE